MTSVINIEIGSNEGGQRLDRFLRKYLPKAPLSFIYKAIRKDVKVNGKRASGELILTEGDVVMLYVNEDKLRDYSETRKHKGVKQEFKIVYEDSHVLAVDKPFGLLTHGDGKEKKNHLTNQVIDYLIEKKEYIPRIEKTFVPAPVNRLDRNTTGLVLFGKTALGLRSLSELIRNGEIEKYYLTIVKGKVTAPLHMFGVMSKDKEKNLVFLEDEPNNGKHMETAAEPLMTHGGYSLLKVRLFTGRTHQIRVQLAAEGYPIIGDAKYGDAAGNKVIKAKTGLTTQLLHAYELKFGKLEGELAELSERTLRAQPPEEFGRVQKVLMGQTKID